MTAINRGRRERGRRRPAVTQVAAGIFRVTQTLRFLGTRFSVNVYVLAGENGLVFDAGYGNRTSRNQLAEAIGQIETLGSSAGDVCRIRRVIPSHSHWDHFSGMAYLQKKPGLELLATEKQIQVIQSARRYRNLFGAPHSFYKKPGPGIPRAIQFIKSRLGRQLFLSLLGVKFVSGAVRVLEEGTVLDTGQDQWDVIELPGHTDDDLSLYCRDKGILLCGDLLLRKVTTWLGPPRSNLKTYIRSLESILALPGLKLILPAHGSPVTEPADRVRQAIAHRHERTGQIADLVQRAGASGISCEAVCRSIYPAVPMFRRHIFEGWICVTLEHLVETGRIRVRYGKRQAVFTYRHK